VWFSVYFREPSVKVNVHFSNSGGFLVVRFMFFDLGLVQYWLGFKVKALLVKKQQKLLIAITTKYTFYNYCICFNFKTMKSIDVKVSLLNNTYSYSLFTCEIFTTNLFTYATSFLRFGLLAHFTLQNLEKKLELASQPKLNSNL
jgi:hypothetical protein